MLVGWGSGGGGDGFTRGLISSAGTSDSCISVSVVFAARCTCIQGNKHSIVLITLDWK